jgi:glutamine amidotransferase
MRVTIVDCGVGNLHSLAKALSGPDTELVMERDPLRALETDVLVLPGVGAFSIAADYLADARDTMRVAIQCGLPTLGVCLGMQLLFESSEEGAGRGLGVFAGDVARLRARRLPHIGWNTIDAPSDGLQGVMQGHDVYYANSYVCRPADASVVMGWTTHEGERFPAAVRAGATLGVQFHPEKSSHAGVALLRDFVREVAG